MLHGNVETGNGTPGTRNNEHGTTGIKQAVLGRQPSERLQPTGLSLSSLSSPLLPFSFFPLSFPPSLSRLPFLSSPIAVPLLHAGPVTVTRRARDCAACATRLMEHTYSPYSIPTHPIPSHTAPHEPHASSCWRACSVLGGCGRGQAGGGHSARGYVRQGPLALLSSSRVCRRGTRDMLGRSRSLKLTD